MKFNTVDDARQAKLVQHSVWLFDIEDERTTLQSMYQSVMINKGRKAMFVKETTGRIALFVDNIANKK